MNQAAFLDAEPAPFSQEHVRQVFRADPDRVRVRLNSILAEIRAALPLAAQRLRLYRAIFPQMSTWLPDEEATRFRLEFDTEVARLERSLAA